MKEDITEVKLQMPLIDNIELEKIDNFYNDIVDEYIKMFVKEKDQVITQYLMKKLREENKQLETNWKELKKWLEEKDNNGYENLYLDDILNKMQELESDNNEKNNS